MGPLYVFLAYTAVVLALAWFSNRLLSKKAFVSEYFLGSRSLGMVALALTFGATSASAGSFAGFPSLVYAHGWTLAVWIASYMIFPLCGMGLLGKRLNYVARKTGAITLPDVLRERFQSTSLAMLATGLLALLLLVYLIPQFKLAALVMQQVLGPVPFFQSAAQGLAGFIPESLPPDVNSGYLLCLFIFAVLVIVYTAFGGFRAVVWTDMLQGFVMVIGVIVLLLMTLSQVGGLTNATAKLAEMTPPALGDFRIEREQAGVAWGLPIDSWVQQDGRLFRLNAPAFIAAEEVSTPAIPAVEIISESERSDLMSRAIPLPPGMNVAIDGMKTYAFGHEQPGTYISAPGPSLDADTGFLPLGLAISFFVFWAMSGTGQPGNMVRLMAFDSSKTLKRAIACLSVYFTLIYLPLVIIFTCARILAPGLDQTPDRIMPVMAQLVTDGAGVPWLAGLLVAVPFAAAMSTVDSFMLMISSSVVRDVYQRTLRPSASIATIKRLSFATTICVGLIATVGAIFPPRFLQYLIVFAGGGLAVAFLMPIALGLYWPRFNRLGAIAAMVGGLACYLALYLMGEGLTPLALMGIDPLIWGFLGSALIGIVANPLGPEPDPGLIQRLF